MTYTEICLVLDDLRRNREKMTLQQYRTIKGQVLSGDVAGAYKGIAKITKAKKEQQCILEKLTTQ